MAVVLEGGCRVTSMREGEPLVEGSLKLWPQVGRDVGAQAISLRVLEFAHGLSSGLCNPDCDEVLYVLEGNGTIFINGQPSAFEPEMGIYIKPGETFAVHNPNNESVVFVSSQCPEPESRANFIGFLPFASPEGDLAIDDSRAVRLLDRRAAQTADRWYRVLVDGDVGSTQVTQFVGSIPPGRAPDHYHQYEEVLFILRGEGRMWAGETHTPIAAGSCIYLPKKQTHCVENLGPGELRLLGVFYPAGSPAVRYDAE